MDPSYLEVEKIGSQQFRARKTFSQLFGERKMWIPGIWKLKTLVHIHFEQENLFCSSFEREKCESLRFGAP